MQTSEISKDPIQSTSDSNITTEEMESPPISEFVNESLTVDTIPNLEPNISEEKLTVTENQDGQHFFTTKEKECWNLYRKMSDKGVRVNFDTLLRGMLTPTEYRNRRQSLAACSSLNEETEESTESLNQISQQ